MQVVFEGGDTRVADNSAGASSLFASLTAAGAEPHGGAVSVRTELAVQQLVLLQVCACVWGGGAGEGVCRYQPKLNRTQRKRARRRAWPML